MPYVHIALSIIKAAGLFLLKHWKEIGVLLIAWLIWSVSASHTADKYELKLAAQEKGYAQAVAGAQAQARQKEHRAAAKFAAIDDKHQKEIQHVAETRERTIAGLRSGALRLRPQFTCSVSEAAAGTSVGDGGEKAGLSREDAEFLVSESARADEIVVQLAACQADLKADRD